MVALPIRIRAVFQDGKFVPQEPCDLPEAAEVQLLVQSSAVSSQVTDPVQRQQILAAVVERMMAQPLPANAPKLTRNELPERV